MVAAVVQGRMEEPTSWLEGMWTSCVCVWGGGGGLCHAENREKMTLGVDVCTYLWQELESVKGVDLVWCYLLQNFRLCW